MATELTMPKNDMDMEEGTIVKWLKNVGDKVEKGEMFMEIETDKTSMEIESPATGVLLAQFYQGGDVVPVNTVMGYVGEAGEAVPEQGAKAAAEEAPKEEKKEAPAAEKAPAKVLSDASGIPATPYAKKLAKDNGIDLKEVVPTGRHGEIRAIDVFTAIEASPVATPVSYTHLDVYKRQGRALAANPQVLLIDEPTSSLDPELVGEVLNLLYKLASQKVTMIIATHEMEFARHIADHVIFLDEGGIVEEGSPDDIFENPSKPRTRQFLKKFEQKHAMDEE